jgi:hypothetical protein
MDLFRSAREAAVVANDPQAQRERSMVVAHEMAVSKREAAQRKHAFRVSGLKTQAVMAGGAAGILGVATLGSGFNPVGDIILAGLAAASGVISFRSSRRAKELAAHPPEVAVPPLPPARLRPGARGAAQADRVRSALLHLYDLIPSVYTLHPQAGHDLARAVSDVEPLLRGQVERLAALDRIECDMPGSAPAWAASQGAQEITNRLDTGAVALEGLITAAAQMLAAPDLVDGVTDVLLPAIDSLQAFAYGLNQASQVQQP